MRGVITGRPKDVVMALENMGHKPKGKLLDSEGRFVIDCAGRYIAKGSGIAGDHRWFYTDTKITAYWRDFRKDGAR